MAEHFLVTGALGCIGAWVVRNLVQQNIPVTVFDLSTDPRRLKLILSSDELARVNCVAGDITDLAALERTLDDNGIQRYLTGTNILETTFRTATAEAVLTDFMPVTAEGRPAGNHREIHRRVHGLRGEMPMRVRFMPRFEYGARSTRLEAIGEGLFASDRTEQVLTLASARPFEWRIGQGAAETGFTLPAGDTRWLVLRHDDDDVHPVDRYESQRKLEETTAFWLRLSSKVRYAGPWRDAVERSALTLKLLTDCETGAVIAAPTTSLPETLGGIRNWDYRFVWLRDAVFTLTALQSVGHGAEADAFMRFLRRVCRNEGGGHRDLGAVQDPHRHPRASRPLARPGPRDGGEGPRASAHRGGAVRGAAGRRARCVSRRQHATADRRVSRSRSRRSSRAPGRRRARTASSSNSIG